MNKIRTLILASSISLFAACSGNANKPQIDTNRGEAQIKQGAPLSQKDWKFYDVEQQSVCIPATWTPVNQHQYLFLVDLTKKSPGAYFIVLKRPKTKDFSAQTGLKEAWNSLLKDTSAKVTADNVVKMNYQDKVVYSGEIKTSGTNMSHTNFITVLEKYNEVFEIAMKIDDGRAAHYAETYKNIVFNFYTRGKLVFNATDKISKMEKVDLDRL